MSKTYVEIDQYKCLKIYTGFSILKTLLHMYRIPNLL